MAGKIFFSAVFLSSMMLTQTLSAHHEDRLGWDLALEMRPVAENAVLISEADYTAQIILDDTIDSKTLSQNFLTTHLGDKAFDFFVQDGSYHQEEKDLFLDENTYEEIPVVPFLDRRTRIDDEADDDYAESAKAFRGLRVAMNELTDLQAFKVGPKKRDGDALASDAGAYIYFVVGRSVDAKLVGFYVGSVET